MKNNTNTLTNNIFKLPKYEKTITVYPLPDGFFIEVIRGEEETDFYICHKNNSIKLLMFGLRNCDKWCEEEMVLTNAEEYMEFYREDYMDC